jgi:hypothetical protein
MSGDGLYFNLSDQLGSTTIMVKGDGTFKGELRYKPFGETRFQLPPTITIPTTFQFTGQRVDSYINLYFYGSRWYDPYF